MTFTSRLLLTMSAMAVLLQMRHSDGFQSVGVGGGGSNSPLWTFDTPIDGGTYATAPGYMGGGPIQGSATLSVFSQTNTNPNGVYPSELSLIRASYVTTQDGGVWISGAGPEAGLVFATITPNPDEETTSPFGPLEAITGMSMSEGGAEEDATTIIATMSGDSVSFFVTAGTGGGGGGGGSNSSGNP